MNVYCASDRNASGVSSPIPVLPSRSQAAARAGGRGPARPPAQSARSATRPPSNSMYLRHTIPIVACLTGNRSIVWLLGTTLLGSCGSRGALSVHVAWCVWLWRDVCGAVRLVRRRRRCGAGACRAPGHAPPSRTTRTDIWSTGPDMSWERDVRVHTHNLNKSIYAYTHIQTHYTYIHITHTQNPYIT